MRSSLFFALPVFVSIAACGATLTRGPTGWHEPPSPYAIAPLEGGALIPPGWALHGYSIEKDGYRRGDDEPSSLDFELKRIEDDGVLLVTHDRLDNEDVAKRPEVLADRWLDHVVMNPKSDDPATKLFAPAVPTLETTATGNVGWHPTSSTIVRGRAAQVDSRQAFTVQGGEAAEVTATLSPPGSPPDRRVYIAVIKQAGRTECALVVYGNTPAMFERGLPDAAAFAHRIRF